MGPKTSKTRKHIKLLYESDKYASNDAILRATQFKFPALNITMQTIYYWKSKLRKEGMGIPRQKRIE